jgi:hypothetical protein
MQNHHDYGSLNVAVLSCTKEFPVQKQSTTAYLERSEDADDMRSQINLQRERRSDTHAVRSEASTAAGTEIWRGRSGEGGH